MFIWKKEFELGIPSIDEQHKNLLEIGNKISNLLMAHEEGDDNYEDIFNVIEELKAYTIYHFDTEEELFVKYDYPNYESHKKEHDDFIDYVESVDFGVIDENQKLFLKELLEKVIKWVFNHILTTDYLYKDHMLKLGLK
jgi:hemerythrin